VLHGELHSGTFSEVQNFMLLQLKQICCGNFAPLNSCTLGNMVG